MASDTHGQDSAGWTSAQDSPDRRPAATPFRVVVIGAGYAGVVAANRVLAGVARRGAGTSVQVTVINPRADFVERIRLHQVAAGTTPSAAFPLADVLHSSARLVVGWAQRIDAAARTVHGSDWSLPYDALVYAVGSRPGVGVPGCADHASGLDAAGAALLRSRVAALQPGDVVAVVGGGLTGVEAAAELAEQHPELAIHVISSGPVVKGLSRAGRRKVLDRLDRMGVERHEGVRVTQVREGELVLGEGVLAFDACVWAGPMTTPELAADSLLEIDGLGRLVVDESLRQPRHPEIVGAGDAVAPPPHVAAHLRMSCAAALPLGAHAGDVVLAAIAAANGGDGSVPRLSVGFALQCLSLGRAGGVVQPVRADGTPRATALGGGAAALVKELICRYTVAAMRAERIGRVAHRGSRGPRRPDAPTAQHPAGSQARGSR